MLATSFVWFQNLPPPSQAPIIAAVIAVVGALAAAFLAFVGVLWTNHGHERRLATQLKNDREQKKVEREMALRKELFLETAEALYAQYTTLFKMADISRPVQDATSGNIEQSVALFKIHLIANDESVAAIVNITGEIGVAIMRLTLERAPLDSINGELASRGARVEQLTAERNNLLEIMKQVSLGGFEDQPRWDGANSMFDDVGKNLDALFKERDKLHQQLYTQWVQFFERCAEESRRIGKMLVPIVGTARRELDLPFDAARYLEITEQSFQLQRQAIEDFSKGFKERLASQENS